MQNIFDQLVLISLLFNELTCLSCMTLSSDCISTNFDYRDSRNVKIKMKNYGRKTYLKIIFKKVYNSN